MDLDLNLAASFVTLAEERHYGRAAARLHMTQSALTKRIQRLERQLGVPLIERPPAGVLQLTVAGRRFAEATGPLLAHAAAVRDAARRQPSNYELRIGYPAGTGAFLSRIGLPGVTQTVRRAFPEARMTCCEVPFPELTNCLPDHRVDVLWTVGPVRHRAVMSFPVRTSGALVGVMSSQHPLAEAGAVDVGTLCEQPMFFNPAIPAEFMDPFLLTEIRPRRQARLVELAATNNGAVLRTLAGGTAVIATVTIAGRAPGGRLRTIELLGAPKVGFHAARRRADRRAAVALLIEQLRETDEDAFA